MELQHDQEVEFKEDKIKLDIPFPSDEGIITKDKAWSILSLGPPVVSKQSITFGIQTCQVLTRGHGSHVCYH